MGVWGRIGKGVVTGGLSEVYPVASDMIAGPGKSQAQIEAEKERARQAAAMPHYDRIDSSAINFAAGGGHLARQARMGQQQNIEHLRALQAGENSVAQAKTQQAMARAVAQQRGMAASATPANRAMAARMAMQNAGNLQAQAVEQGNIAGLQERQMATNALVGALQGQRNLDVNAAGEGLRIQAGLSSDQMGGNLDAERIAAGLQTDADKQNMMRRKAFNDAVASGFAASVKGT